MILHRSEILEEADLVSLHLSAKIGDTATEAAMGEPQLVVAPLLAKLAQFLCRQRCIARLLPNRIALALVTRVGLLILVLRTVTLPEIYVGGHSRKGPLAD